MHHELLRFSLRRLQQVHSLARAAFRRAMMRSMSSISAGVGIFADVRGVTQRYLIEGPRSWSFSTHDLLRALVRQVTQPRM